MLTRLSPPVRVAADSDADLVAAAINEIIYRLDAGGQIPAAVEVSRAADGGIELRMHTVPTSAAQTIGAVPKAAATSGLTCASERSGRWTCAVTIDV